METIFILISYVALHKVKIRPLMDGNFKLFIFINCIIIFVKIRPLMDGNALQSWEAFSIYERVKIRPLMDGNIGYIKIL